jgi:hypothetical protein
MGISIADKAYALTAQKSEFSHVFKNFVDGTYGARYVIKGIDHIRQAIGLAKTWKELSGYLCWSAIPRFSSCVIESKEAVNGLKAAWNKREGRVYEVCKASSTWLDTAVMGVRAASLFTPIGATVNAGVAIAETVNDLVDLGTLSVDLVHEQRNFKQVSAADLKTEASAKEAINANWKATALKIMKTVAALVAEVAALFVMAFGGAPLLGSSTLLGLGIVETVSATSAFFIKGRAPHTLKQVETKDLNVA